MNFTASFRCSHGRSLCRSALCSILRLVAVAQAAAVRKTWQQSLAILGICRNCCDREGGILHQLLRH